MIRRIALASSLAIFLAFASTQLQATTYTLEPDYTQGVFRWSHLGFSSPAAQIGQGQGTLEFDRGDPTRASVKVSFALATLNTGVPDLDKVFRSDEFFETARYPTATFQSRRVEKGSMGQLNVTGDLSLHGVTRPVTLAVTIVKVGSNPRTSLPTIGFDATTTLKRSDFGLGAYVPQVSDEIQLRLICQAVEAQPYAEYLKAEAAAEAAAAKQSPKK